jgi:RNase adapter protein RapZ
MSRDRPRLVLITGLSGSGKLSVLHALEDLGFETVDNPPLGMVEALARETRSPLAIGVHARSQEFDAGDVLDMMGRLREAGLRPELVYAWADEEVLLRRYTETRRRHPLSPHGRVSDGIHIEERLTAELREAADLMLDTSALPLASLRGLVERHFGAGSAVEGQGGLNVSLISFAFPAGLPREADLVFDARFLRNPHYDPILRPRTGLDPEVGAYVEADPDFAAFFATITNLLTLLLPRFVQEGKKYSTIAIGCTGGRHRSVHLVERLAAHLTGTGWRANVTHRELAREAGFGAGMADHPGSRRDGFPTEPRDSGSNGPGSNGPGAKGGATRPAPHRAQEA